MEHISLPIKADSSYYGNKYFLRDSEGLEIISTPELGYTEDVLEQIALAVNAYDDLLAALVRAEQTFRNLASDGSIVTMGTSLEIAHNELENMRDEIAKARGDQCTA